MSKCMRGIPWYDTKIKDAAQTHQINKALDEAEAAPEQRGYAQGTANILLDNSKAVKEALVYFPNETTRYHSPGVIVTKSDISKTNKILDYINNLLSMNKKGGKYTYRYLTRFNALKASNESESTAENRQAKEFGTISNNLNLDTLTPDVFPVIKHWLDIANKITNKFKIPGVRTISNRSADLQREGPSVAASFGDGIMNISSIYFNKLFSAGKQYTAEETKTLDSIARQIREIYTDIVELNKKNADVTEEYQMLSELNYRHSLIANFNEVDASKEVGRYLNFGNQSNNISEYYSTAEHKALAIMYHELGHHIHQQYGVHSDAKLKTTDIEQLLIWWRTRAPYGVRHLTKYSEFGGRTPLTEWFAENHAYWAMDKYEGVAPLGKSEKVLDPFFVFLMETLEKGIGSEPYGNRILNENNLRQQLVNEQLMQAVDIYMKGL